MNITINNLRFGYGSKRPVYSNLSLTLNEGCICGLLGKNGTGKSTLLYLIAGLLKAQSGDILVDGMHSKERHPELLRNIYLLPEEPMLPSLSLNDCVAMHRDYYPLFSNDILRECLADFQLLSVNNLKQLSMGQRKKVMMALALAANTPLLMMDEPTNGLDIPSKSLFRKLIARYMDDNRLFIISTHQVHDVEPLIDRVVMLEDDRLLANTSVEAITRQWAFRLREGVAKDNDIVYSEPAPGGQWVVTRRTDDEETPLNLELFFNAMATGAITLNENTTTK